MSAAKKRINWYENNEMEAMTKQKIKYEEHKLKSCLLYVLQSRLFWIIKFMLKFQSL